MLPPTPEKNKSYQIIVHQNVREKAEIKFISIFF